MKDLQRWGGIAAFYMAGAYIAGILYFILIAGYPSAVSPAEKIALLAEHRTGMHLITLLIYQVFAVVLVILTLALYERLKAGAPTTMKLAAVFGLIWSGVLVASGMIFTVGMSTTLPLAAETPAQAETLWTAIDTIHIALGGGSEFLGGLWLLFISLGALKTHSLSKPLNYLGLIIAACGILSDLPTLSFLGMAFGLTQIAWFLWLGVILVRR